MTTEEKAKAYDEAIEKIKYVMEHGVSPVLNKEDLQDIFPELKESEDEKTRKELIELFNDLWEGKQGLMTDRKDYERYIAWLKKQQNNKSIGLKEGEKIRKGIIKSIGDLNTEWLELHGVTKVDALAWLEKQGEHANFLSKIQVGDKVTRNEAGILVNISQLNRIAKPRVTKPVDKVVIKKDEKHIAWSEEDEHHWMMCVECVEECATQEREDFSKTINWLKSLKQRMEEK